MYEDSLVPFPLLCIPQLLTLSTHAHEGYSLFVLTLVRAYVCYKLNLLTRYLLLSKGFQLTDVAEKLSFSSSSLFFVFAWRNGWPFAIPVP